MLKAIWNRSALVVTVLKPKWNPFEGDPDRGGRVKSPQVRVAGHRTLALIFLREK